MALAGGIARKYLAEHYGVVIRACVYQIGDIFIERKDWNQVAANPFFVGDASTVKQLGALIDQIRKEGDSIGAAIYAEASGVPAGWGEPVFDRLDADRGGPGYLNSNPNSISVCLHWV